MTSGDPIVHESDVVFGTGGGDSLKCDVYRPPTDEATSAIILLRRRDPAPLTQVMAHRLAQRGHLAIVSEYRIGFRVTDKGFAPFAGEEWPGPLHDAKAAVRWTRAHSAKLGIDPDAIAVYGGSNAGLVAGVVAGTADVAALEGNGGNAGVSSRVAAAVLAYTPTTLSKWGIPLIVGAHPTPELIAEASPMTHVGPKSPATLFLHGDADKLIEPSNSVDMHNRLRAAGVPSELHLYAGLDHQFDLQPAFMDHVADLISLFMRRYASPASNPRPL
jgi:acetyl esterase/lipase